MKNNTAGDAKLAEAEDTPFKVADMAPSSPSEPAQTSAIRFCNYCGSGSLERKIPVGDNQLRLVCPTCGKIHYQDSKIVTGCIASYGNKVLLCRRAIEPRLGQWSLPSGYLEPGESSLRSAVREAREETNASVSGLHLYCIYEMPQINHVFLIFQGRLRVPVAFPGEESIEVGFFSKETLPWDELAFPSEHEALRQYFLPQGVDDIRFHAAEFFWTDETIRIQRF